jgi:hypothetical protein
MVTFILLVVGGLNWLLVGLFDWGVANVVGAGVAQLVYILVGLSAIYEVATHKGNCKACEAMMATPPAQPMGSMGAT